MSTQNRGARSYLFLISFNWLIVNLTKVGYLLDMAIVKSTGKHIHVMQSLIKTSTKGKHIFE